VLHSQLATMDPYHCPHVSFLPQEDSGGVVKCQKSAMTEYDTYFDEWCNEKYKMFKEANSWRVDVEEGYNIYDIAAGGNWS